MEFTEPTSTTVGTGLQTTLQLISESQYAAYTSQWSSVVGSTNDLNSYFTEGGQRLLYAYYGADAIVNLVSSPTIDKVKVRFGIVDDQFVVISFACNAAGAPVSAYFMALNATSYEAGSPGDPSDNDGGNGLVPTELAETWIQNWADADSITRPQFLVDEESMEGTLRGYTFDADDFRNTLFGDGLVTDQIVRVRFALHEYYRPGATNLSALFGLVLDSYGPGVESGTYFDFSAPCPPTC